MRAVILWQPFLFGRVTSYNSPMWVVSVMPIGKVVQQRELSYWSAKELAEGSIAKIPARGKTMFGLVMKCAPLSDMKQHVRTAGFTLQKITGGAGRIVTREFLRAAFELGNWHACSAGAVLSDLVPQAVLEAAAKMPEISFTIPTARDEKKWDAENCVVASRTQRITEYRRLAREVLSSGKSFLCIAPTVAEASRIARALARADYAVVLMHGALSKKNMREAWGAAARHQRPLVIVGTALVLSIPRSDIGCIVLERALASGYSRDERPFLDIGVCARTLARAVGARFITGSAAPTVEVIYRGTKEIKNHNAVSKAPIKIIDMRPPIVPSGGERILPVSLSVKKPFSVFSDVAIQYIERTLAGGENVLVISARRGLSTQTVCDDCGATLTCPSCNSAFVLYEKNGKRIFQCPYCGVKESSHTKCRVCGSWRLSPLGVGLERVVIESKKLFPNVSLFTADEATLKKPTLAARMVADFEASHGALLLGTEGVLAHLETSVPLAVAVSIDSFLFQPEYSASERTFQLLAELRGLTSETLLIQTRVPEHAAIKALSHNDDVSEFAQEELALRERFFYPPHTTLIRITLAGSAARIHAEREALLKTLAPYKPQLFAGRPAAYRGKMRSGSMREHILVRLPTGEWPERRLLSLLRSLPSSVEIRVNPKTIFGN